MGDAGEGLVDAEARVQERMDELARERTVRSRKVPCDPAALNRVESLRRHARIYSARRTPPGILAFRLPGPARWLTSTGSWPRRRRRWTSWSNRAERRLRLRDPVVSPIGDCRHCGDGPRSVPLGGPTLIRHPQPTGSPPTVHRTNTFRTPTVQCVAGAAAERRPRLTSTPRVPGAPARSRTPGRRWSR